MTGGAVAIHSMFRVSHQETGWEVHIYIGTMFNIVYSRIKIDERGAGEVMDANETSGLC